MRDARLASRIARIREALRDDTLDALLVSQPESRYYLSGYTGHDLPPRDSAGYLLITRDRLSLVTDSRTIDQARSEAPDYQIVEGRDIGEALSTLLSDAGPQTIGFEGIHLPYHIVESARSALAGRIDLRETVGLVDGLRILKDDLELDALRAAITVSDACMQHLLNWLHPGHTERAVAWEAESFMRSHGASGIAFDVIVASGPNSAMPHAVPTDRVIRTSEPVTIDMGAAVGHYLSDMTRTICFGKPPRWLLGIYRLVLEGQEVAERGIRAGMTGRNADAIAREVIVKGGYGDHFRHSLGHGIGLEAHEPPSLSTRSNEALKPGMVFSVEPGIYLPGKGGVRIEDLVHLSDAGPVVLTSSRKDEQLLHLS